MIFSNAVGMMAQQRGLTYDQFAMRMALQQMAANQHQNASKEFERQPDDIQIYTGCYYFSNKHPNRRCGLILKDRMIVKTRNGQREYRGEFWKRALNAWGDEITEFEKIMRALQ